MKFESTKNRSPREWRNILRAASFGSLDSSQNSTVYVENEVASFDKGFKNVVTIRRVHFCEERNKAYANPEEHDYIAQDRWYTKTEIHLCRAETRYMVHLAGASNHEEGMDLKFSWSHCLKRKYLSFCSLQVCAGQEVATYAVPPCHISTIGLERKVLAHTVVRDKRDRRRRLLQRFRTVHDTVMNRDTRAALIAQASTETSQPSRMFAAFLAEWWWYHAMSDEHEV